MSEEKIEFIEGLALLKLADRKLQQFADKDLIRRINSLELDLIDRHTTDEDVLRAEVFRKRISDKLESL